MDKTKKIVKLFLLIIIIASCGLNSLVVNAHTHDNDCSHVESNMITAEHSSEEIGSLYIHDNNCKNEEKNIIEDDFIEEDLDLTSDEDVSLMSTSPGNHIHEYFADTYSERINLGSSDCYKITIYQEDRCRVCLQWRGTRKEISTTVYSHSYNTNLRGCDDVWDSWRTECRTCGYIYETSTKRCIH